MHINDQPSTNAVSREDTVVLTIKEAAAILRCSNAHLSHVLNGKVLGLPTLPHVRIGRRVLIRRSALFGWLVSVETKREVQ